MHASNALVRRLMISTINVIAAVGLAVSAQHVSAQAFPNKPITVIFPFSAGSPVDTAFRDIAAHATKTLGQPVLLEARPGANNRLGLAAIKAAPADGYTLTMAFDAVLVSQPILDPGFQIEPGRDYLPVHFTMEFPLVMVASTTPPVKNVKDIIAFAKANPGKVNFAGVGGATGYFMLERIRQASGIDVAMVPYKGSPQAMTDLLAGRVHVLLTAATARPFIESGKLIGIATTGRERWSAFPELPTLTESGVAVANTAWYGLVAAPGTPADAIAKLNAAFNVAVRAPEVRKVLEEKFGITSGRNPTPEEFTAFIRAESKSWTPILKSSGIKME